MERKIGRLHTVKTRTQLILVYLIAGLLPLLCIGGYLIIRSGMDMLRYEETKTHVRITQLKKEVFDFGYLSYRLSETISNDAELRSILTAEYADKSDVYRAFRSYGTLDQYLRDYTELLDIQVHTEHPSLFDYGRFHSESADARAAGWYQRAAEGGLQPFWAVEDTISRYAQLHLIRRINLPAGKPRAVLVISISNEFLSSLLSDPELEARLCLDEEWVYTADSGRFRRAELPFPIKGKSGISESYRARKGGRELLARDVALIGVNTGNHFQILVTNDCLPGIYRILRGFFIILLLASGIPLVIILIYSHLFSARLRSLRNDMHEIATGNLSIQGDVRGTDEAAELFRDMKATVLAMRELNEKVYREQLEKQQMELEQQQIRFELLASQINPHFLFNTLESIRMKATIDGNRDLSGVILKLGKMLRYSLDCKGAEVALRDELTYLEAYNDIQRFRFQNKIQCLISVDPKIRPEETFVLPLILQPFVENAYSHGFPGKKDGGMIRVSILLRDGDLQVMICDNGAGMPEEALSALRQRMDRDTEGGGAHIGICNVHKRIRTHYGEEYGVEPASSEKGFSVLIKLPCITRTGDLT